MASQKPPPHYPITGLCIVADPQKCPPSYELLMKSHDRKDDCDLGTESFMRKNSRYLCFTRTYATSGRNNVLCAMQLTNEKELPATGFSVIDRTCDTSEKSLKKKQIAVRMAPRDATTDAICDIVIMSKSKRPPDGYTLAGEVNGLSLCYKMNKVPVETQVFSHANVSQTVPGQPARPAPLPPIGGGGHPSVMKTAPAVAKAPVPAPRPAVLRTDAAPPGNPLSDVTFHLNIKHQDFKTQLKTSCVFERDYRSSVDINSEYNYEFILERSAIQKLPSSPTTLNHAF